MHLTGQRLTILAIVVVAVVAVVAGCLGGVSKTESPPTPSNITRHELPDRSPQSRFSTLSVGTESDLPGKETRKHIYEIWNNQTDSTQISITIWRENEIVLNLSQKFPPNGVLGIQVFKPGGYTLAVEMNGSRWIIDVPDRFDCNEHLLEVAILDKDKIAVLKTHTQLSC